MNFCRLDLDGKELKTLRLKWKDRTQKSLNLCQRNIMSPNKWAWQASSFAERPVQLKNRFLLLFLNNNMEIMFSASSNKQKHYCYLHCAFSRDSKCCVIAEEHVSPLLYEGLQGFHYPKVTGQNQKRFGSKSEHWKAAKRAGCGKG